MDVVFNYIERYKFAIVGTILFHVAVFIGFNFTTLKRPWEFKEEMTAVEIPFDEIEFDEQMMEMLEIPEKNNNMPEEILNAAADENDSRNESRHDFSTSQIDADVANEARDLEAQYFEEWASTHSDKEASADIEIEKDDRTNDNRTPDNTIDKGGDNKAAGSVLVSYNLKDRSAHSLPKPGYTCNRSGTVKIIIKVDNNGNLKNVSYSAAGSKNASECMIQQALKYAKRSRFDFSGSAPAAQSGSITYKFVGQ